MSRGIIAIINTNTTTTLCTHTTERVQFRVYGDDTRMQMEKGDDDDTLKSKSKSECTVS